MKEDEGKSVVIEVRMVSGGTTIMLTTEEGVAGVLIDYGIENGPVIEKGIYIAGDRAPELSELVRSSTILPSLEVEILPVTLILHGMEHLERLRFCIGNGVLVGPLASSIFGIIRTTPLRSLECLRASRRTRVLKPSWQAAGNSVQSRVFGLGN